MDGRMNRILEFLQGSSHAHPNAIKTSRTLFAIGSVLQTYTKSVLVLHFYEIVEEYKSLG